MERLVMGVDEAGRAPLAGPVSVGFILLPERFDVLQEFPGLRDSKQLTPHKREVLYDMLLARKKNGDVRFCVRFSDHRYIDEHGITKAVRRAIIRGVRYLAPDCAKVKILLDGLLFAPSAYEQQTIINGDELIPIISLASVAAKVERDRLMSRMAKKFPAYGFQSHKGYGTRRHWKAIHAFGLCDIHRRTYCKT